VVLIFVAHRVAPFLLYTLAVAGAAVCALGTVFISPAVFFVAMGAPAGLFFPGFYVTASGKMGEDLRVPPTIIARAWWAGSARR
jgi:MFS transporter, FHS family, glucose/mannose:H+ symporter